MWSESQRVELSGIQHEEIILFSQLAANKLLVNVLAFLGFLAGAALGGLALGGLAGYALGAWTGPAWYGRPYCYAPSYYYPTSFPYYQSYPTYARPYGWHPWYGYW